MPSIASLCLFYLLLTQNFISKLAPCGLQRLLSCSMIARHVVGFLSLLTFSIVIVDSGTKSFEEIIYQCFIVYLLFLVSSRLSQKISVLFLILCSVIYILYLYENTTNYNKLDETKQKKILLSIWILTICLYIVAAIGVMYYYRKKRIEYGKNFNHVNFLFGTLKCKSIKCAV